MMRGLSIFFLLLFLGAFGLLSIYSPNSTLASNITPSSISSRSIALTADGSILCVANPDSDSLSLVDIKTSSLLVEIPVGDDPRAVAAGEKFAYVTNHGSDSISIIDLESQTRVADLPVGDRPVGVALSPDNRFLVVAEMGQDSVRFIETKTLNTLVSFPVPDRPFGLSFTPDGKALLVTHLLSGEITRIPVQSYASYFPYTIFNWDLPSSLSTLQQTPRARMVKVSFLHGQGTSIPTWTHIAPAPSVLVNNAGTRAYLPQTMGNGQGLNTQFDTTVFPVVSVIDLDTNTLIIEPWWQYYLPLAAIR